MTGLSLSSWAIGSGSLFFMSDLLKELSMASSRLSEKVIPLAGSSRPCHWRTWAVHCSLHPYAPVGWLASKLESKITTAMKCCAETRSRHPLRISPNSTQTSHPRKKDLIPWTVDLVLRLSVSPLANGLRLLSSFFYFEIGLRALAFSKEWAPRWERGRRPLSQPSYSYSPFLKDGNEDVRINVSCIVAPLLSCQAYFLSPVSRDLIHAELWRSSEQKTIIVFLEAVKI